MNSQMIKEYARLQGADLVGIASIEHLKDLPPDSNPLSIMPECKCIIVMARRILRGSIRGVEEGTNFNSTYAMYGFRTLEENFLSRTVYDVSCFVERFGFEGVPIFAYEPDDMAKGIPVAPGKPAPNVIIDVRSIVQAAGLAETGLGDFLITPEYGTRQRFGFVLTDAALECDSVREKTICADCGKCADVCPLGAINLKTMKKVGVKGHEMDVAEVNYELCANCPNGAMTGPGRGRKPDRIAAICARECLIQLEHAEKLKNKFVNRFRKRSPWAFDIYKNKVKTTGISDDQVGCLKRYD